jgi:hypothetical protein
MIIIDKKDLKDNKAKEENQCLLQLEKKVKMILINLINHMNNRKNHI